MRDRAAAIVLLAGLATAVGGCASGSRNPLASVSLQATPGETAASRTPVPERRPIPELVTDRPDFTESTSVVPARHVQIEAGYTFIRDEDHGVRTAHGYPEALARIGVAERLEVRVGQNVLTTTSPGAGGRQVQATGAEDLYLGTKVYLGKQQRGRPEMVLIAQATVPTGAEDFTAGRALPGINFIYGWDLFRGLLSMTASTQANGAVNAEDGSYVELTQSVSVGFTLSERVGAYTEWFAFFPTGRQPGVSAAHSIDGGFTVKVGPRVQLDARIGFGLTGPAAGFFAGSGLAILY